ncbi:MAG TPA: lactonase family protein [Methylomirabilota bacterium]|nr:lactonase family protein [Methylomirabilota bacterium]
MKITRRFFVLLAVSMAAALVAFTTASSQPATHDDLLAFVGTYTNKTESKGIYAFEFDADSGKLKAKGLAAAATDPSWVEIHPNGKYAYAANETGNQSTITAYSVDAKKAKLTQLNQLPSLGQDPCHLSFDRTGKYLFAANYSSGTIAVFPILPDGKLGEHTAVVKNVGNLGPNKERQEAPHAHWVHVSPDNHYVFVADLGLDAILSYKFDATKGTLTPNNPPFAKLNPGSGPRHVAFSPDGKYVYVVSELNSTVTAFQYDPAKGTLFQFQILTTLAQDFSGRNDTAEITVHSNGKWLFASNRGRDTITVFSISPTDGSLTSLGEFPTGGKEPRHFAIDPTGQYVLAENQNSNSITVLKIDPATGALKEVSHVNDIPSPVCLAFLP